MIDKTDDKEIKVDQNIDGFIFPKVPKGVVAIIQVEGSSLMVTVTNPKKGDPKIAYNIDGFIGINGLVMGGDK
jgi:hypothetical protein